MRAAENPIKTPQAKARCGVSGRKIQAMQKIEYEITQVAELLYGSRLASVC